MISIIIPVLNEEQGIIKLLDLLIDRAAIPQELEIIISDGGSNDNTLEKVLDYTRANNYNNISTLKSTRGRGKQLHHGAQHAHGDILYFLHADSYPPKNYDQHIIKAIKAGHPAGCFRMRFRTYHWWLLIIGWFSRFNWRASRGGDQSQYITKELYDEIGGYDTQVPIYEDYLLVHKLYDRNTFHVIQKWLTTSARRYKEVGVWRLQWFYITIYWKRRHGATIKELNEYYIKWCSVQCQ